MRKKNKQNRGIDEIKNKKLFASGRGGIDYNENNIKLKKI